MLKSDWRALEIAVISGQDLQNVVILTQVEAASCFSTFFNQLTPPRGLKPTLECCG